MELRQLELFIAVAEEGSIHRGARRVMLAQPAVSKALRRLEHHLGSTLLERSSTGIELTPAGDVLLGHARDVVSRLDVASEAVRAAGRRERTMRVGLIAGPVAAAGLTSDLLRTFTRHHRDIRLKVRELSFIDQFSAVESGEVDVAIVRPPYLGDALTITELFEEPVDLCCRSDHALSTMDDLEIADVLDLPMVDMAEAPPGWTGFWHLESARNGPARKSIDSARTLAELQNALLWGDNHVIPLARSAWTLAMAEPTLRLIPLSGAPTSQVAIAKRAGDPREDIAQFTDCAATVTSALVDRVDGGRLVA